MRITDVKVILRNTVEYSSNNSLAALRVGIVSDVIDTRKKNFIIYCYLVYVLYFNVYTVEIGNTTIDFVLCFQLGPNLLSPIFQGLLVSYVHLSEVNNLLLRWLPHIFVQESSFFACRTKTLPEI